MRSFSSRGGRSPTAWAMTRPRTTTKSVGAQLHGGIPPKPPASCGSSQVMPIWATSPRRSTARRTWTSKLADEQPAGRMQNSSIRGRGAWPGAGLPDVARNENRETGPRGWSNMRQVSRHDLSSIIRTRGKPVRRRAGRGFGGADLLQSIERVPAFTASRRCPRARRRRAARGARRGPRERRLGSRARG